jgi:SAM-dependent methyltransferase
MNESAMRSDDRFMDERFPRSNAYHPEWVVASASGGANSLWLTEWLTSALDLKSGMNVLDLGCGLAASSIFLTREFNVTVWATDLWFSASDNQKRVLDAGVEKSVYPIHADARSLPFAGDFFDAIVGGAGLIREIEGSLPDHLQAWWAGEPDMWCLHSPEWWRRHWERTSLVDIELADTMPDGWQFWLKWHRSIAPDNPVEIRAVESDRGKHLGYLRVIGRRRPNVHLDDPVVSVPSHYARKPLLRGSL